MTCPECGVDYGIGQWYRCPHEAIRQGRGADVTWPGGQTFENLGPEPVTFYSPAEKSRYMRQHGLQEFVRHVPVPGSDKSPHTTSWSGIDAQTLANAAALVEYRGGSGKDESKGWVESMDVTVTTERGYITEPIRGIHVG